MKNLFALLLLLTLCLAACKDQEGQEQNQLTCETNNLANAILRFEVEAPNGEQFCVQSDAIASINPINYQAGSYPTLHRKVGLSINFATPVSAQSEQHLFSLDLIQHEEDFDLLDPETQYYITPEDLVMRLFRRGEFEEDRHVTVNYAYDGFSLVAWKNTNVDKASLSISHSELNEMNLTLKGSFTAQADRWFPIGEEDHIIKNAEFNLVIDLDEIF